MFGDALSWYLTSMAEFWGSAFRIGLPQILLIILVICWLRRKRGAKGCCWSWACGSGGEEEESDWSGWEGGCRCTCGRCRRRQEVETDADADGGDDE